MNAIQWHEIVKLAVERTEKWACYVNNGLDYGSQGDDEVWTFVRSEVRKNYPDDFYEILSNLISGGLFFFDTEEECYKFYEIFNQPLTDSSAIYASTYNPEGECQTENT